MDKSASPGALLDTTGNTTVMVTDGIAMGYFLRPYTTTNGGFNFTDFMECNVDGIDLIAGIGTGTVMGYHAQRVSGAILTRLSTCLCEDDTDTGSDTTEMPDDGESTTELPDDGGSANSIFNVFNIIGILYIGIYWMTA